MYEWGNYTQSLTTDLQRILKRKQLRRQSSLLNLTERHEEVQFCVEVGWKSWWIIWRLAYYNLVPKLQSAISIHVDTSLRRNSYAEGDVRCFSLLAADKQKIALGLSSALNCIYHDMLSALCAIARSSARLSVTWVIHTKTAEDRIIKFSPYGSLQF